MKINAFCFIKRKINKNEVHGFKSYRVKFKEKPVATLKRLHSL